MRKPMGYGIWVGEGPSAEADTITCGHCNAVVFVKPGTGSTIYLLYGMDPTHPPHEEPGAFCRVCMTPVCLRCHAVGTCIPFERQLEAMEARGRLLAAVAEG